MSKVQLQGNVSGTGVFTIASPNSNTDRTLTLPDQTGTLLSNSAQGIPRSALPVGSILQTVTVFKNDTFSTTASNPTWADITGLSVAITPTSASSRILVLATINIGSNADSLIRLLRDSTAVGNGSGGNINGIGQTAPGPNSNLMYQPFCFATSYVDSPATTSSVTYKIQGTTNGSGTLWINRRSIEGSFVVSSSITVMEVAT